jgi:transcriptional regulator with XRE-family HTH domain
MVRKPGRTRDVREVGGKEAFGEVEGRSGRGPGAPRDAEFSALAVRYLDSTVGPRHDQFAKLVGISPARLSLYRYGYTVPRPDTMSRFAEKVGLPLEWVEAVTADAMLLRGGSAKSTGGESATSLAEALARRLVGQLAPRLAALRSGAPPPPPPPPSLERAAEDRAEAAERWAEIEPLTAAERSMMVLEIPAFYSWALVELLCGKSAAAADPPTDAVALARLVVKLARRVHASQGFRNRLMGYALLHLAHALQKQSDLPRAREARARGLRLFEAGRAEDPGLLDDAIMEGLAAS